MKQFAFSRASNVKPTTNYADFKQFEFGEIIEIFPEIQLKKKFLANYSKSYDVPFMCFMYARK